MTWLVPGVIRANQNIFAIGINCTVIELIALNISMGIDTEELQQPKIWG